MAAEASGVLIPDEATAVAVVTGEVEVPEWVVDRVLDEAMLVLKVASLGRLAGAMKL